LFDPWAHLGDKRLKLLEKSWAGVFRKHLLKNLPVDRFAARFDQTQGRPSKDLYVALGALVLQQVHDLTDAQTVEALALNLGWHYALDIRDTEDAYLCERSLRNYRHWVIEQGLDEELFRGLTDRLIQGYGVGGERQRIDSTRVRSFMRNLTRLGIVVETIRKFLRELKRAHPQSYRAVDEKLTERYFGNGGKGCFEYAKPSVAKRQLKEVARDLWTLKVQFEKSEVEALDSYRLLARVFDGQCEAVADEDAEQGAIKIEVKAPKDVPCDGVLNPADPDADYKTPHGVGYGVQVMETYSEDEDPDNVDDEDADETSGEQSSGNASSAAASHPAPPDLITHVEVHSISDYDGDHIQGALDSAAERSIAPATLLGDTHYGALENVRRAAERGVEIVAPAQLVRKPGGDPDRLALEDFELDDRGLIEHCPCGHRPQRTSMSRGSIYARFDRALCSTCAQRKHCPVRRNRRFKNYRIQYSRDRVVLRRRRLHERTDAFKDRYRWRAGIEATMSRLKHQMGVAHLRVRGMKSVRYTVTLRALGLNIKRCEAWEARKANARAYLALYRWIWYRICLPVVWARS
jgi:hypothetical protein